MADPNEPVEKTVIEQPATVRTEIRAGGSGGANVGWWVAALVAIVAIVGAYFFYNRYATSELELQAARDSGRAEAMVEDAAARAQAAADAASQASSAAASNVAEAGRAAAERADVAAERTEQAARSAAASAEDAAADAAAREPEPPPPRY